MKRLFFHLVSVLAIMVSDTVFAMEYDWPASGERLRYTVRWGFLKAGEAELLYMPQMENNYAITALAWTGGVGSLFKLRDRINVTGHHPTLAGEESPFMTQSYTLHLRENDYRAHKRVVYLRDSNEAVYTNVLAGEEPRAHPVPRETRDMISALYHLRKTVVGANPGDTFTLPVFDLDKSYLMHVKILERSRQKTALGETNLLHVQPVMEGISERRSSDRWHIWVTDDERLLPVKFRVQLRFGSFTAKLIEAGPPEHISTYAPSELRVDN